MLNLRKCTLLAVLTTGLAVRSARADYVFTSFDGPAATAGQATANGINSLGQVVGFNTDTGGMILTNFVRNTDGSFTTLSAIDNMFGNAMANGINQAGNVVGTDSNEAFLVQGATLTALAAPNPGHTGSEAAFGINNNGDIVGQYVDTSTGNEPGFLLSGGTFTILNPTAKAMVTNAQGINNNGTVVGFYANSDAPTVQHGFLYDSNSKAYTLLNDPTPTLAQGQSIVLTQFLGINDKDLAVGYYQTTDGSQHGLIYNADTNTYTFLDDPSAATTGVSTTQITGINDIGQITGFYVDKSGIQHGFFAATPVPLPPAAWSGLSLLAALATFNATRTKRTPI